MTFSIAYGGTGLAATVYYRKELLKSFKNFMLIGVAPTLGAIIFAWWSSSRSSITITPTTTDVASYTGIHGIGGVFLMGVGTMVLGVILIVAMSMWKISEFLRRRPETWPGEGEPIPYADKRYRE